MQRIILTLEVHQKHRACSISRGIAINSSDFGTVIIPKCAIWPKACRQMTITSTFFIISLCSSREITTNTKSGLGYSSTTYGCGLGISKNFWQYSASVPCHYIAKVQGRTNQQPVQLRIFSGQIFFGGGFNSHLENLST